MARADQTDARRPQLSSASFRSATSYASFRSCRSIKSVSSRASFRSALSRANSYYSCADQDTDLDNVRTGLVNEGYQVELEGCVQGFALHIETIIFFVSSQQ